MDYARSEGCVELAVVAIPVESCNPVAIARRTARRAGCWFYNWRAVCSRIVAGFGDCISIAWGLRIALGFCTSVQSHSGSCYRVDCAVAVLAVELGGYSLRIGLLLFCGECEMIDKLHGTRIAKCSGLG